MIIYVLIGLGIILPLITLTAKQKSAARNSLSIVAIAFSLLALVVSFISRNEYNTQTGRIEYQENHVLNIIAVVGSTIGFVLGTIAILIKSKTKKE